MYVVNVRDARESKTPHGKSVRWLVTKEVGAPNFEMRYFEIGKESEPSESSHPWEHEVFVVKGEGMVRSGGVERKIEAGDALFIPPHEAHTFWNLREEPLGFICIIPAGCEDNVKPRTEGE